MEKQQKCKRKKALCDGKECKKCCLQGDDSDDGSRKDDQGSDSVAFGNIVTIKTTRGTTFDYYDSDARAIEKLITYIHNRGISPKDIIRVQLVQDSIPKIVGITLNSKVGNETSSGYAVRLRAACPKMPYIDNTVKKRQKTRRRNDKTQNRKRYTRGD